MDIRFDIEEVLRKNEPVVCAGINDNLSAIKVALDGNCPAACPVYITEFLKKLTLSTIREGKIPWTS